MAKSTSKLPAELEGMAPHQVAAAQQPFVPYAEGMNAAEESKNTSRHTGFTKAQHEAAAKLPPVKLGHPYAQHARKTLHPDSGQVAPGAKPRPSSNGEPHAFTPDYDKKIDPSLKECVICGFDEELHKLARTLKPGDKWDPETRTWG